MVAIQIQLTGSDTVDVRLDRNGGQSFSLDFDDAQRLGIELLETVASARDHSERLFQDPPKSDPIRPEFTCRVAEDGRTVRFLMHLRRWEPVIVMLDADAVDDLLEKLRDVRQQLAMENE